MSRFAELNDARDIVEALCSCANTLFRDTRKTTALFALASTLMAAPGCLTVNYTSGGSPSLGQLLNINTNVSTHNMYDNPGVATRSGSITFPGSTGRVFNNPLKR